MRDLSTRGVAHERPAGRLSCCGVTAAATPGPRHGRSRPSFSDATPAEVRAALIPEEAAEFDQQWRELMATATETLDLSEVLATLESWRRVARLTAVTGPEAHRHIPPGGRPDGRG
jgi:Family of unknown function (DUF6247)